MPSKLQTHFDFTLMIEQMCLSCYQWSGASGSRKIVNGIRLIMKEECSHMPSLISSPDKIASDMATKIRASGLNIAG